MTDPGTASSERRPDVAGTGFLGVVKSFSPALRELLVSDILIRFCERIPFAFVVLRDGFTPSPTLDGELRAFVAERLAHHKQPREICFIDAVPRNPSGKILRRELRKNFGGQTG